MFEVGREIALRSAGSASSAPPNRAAALDQITSFRCGAGNVGLQRSLPFFARWNAGVNLLRNLTFNYCPLRLLGITNKCSKK